MRFPRIVRDLAHKCGKEINLVALGEGTEIDKKVMELLVDPLTHLIRNAVDHGIEDAAIRQAAGKSPIGTVTLSATQEGNNIVIEMSDDGQGINLEKVLAKAIAAGIAREDKTYTKDEIIDFIFKPGFSTADTVTDVSGRGVGLDVVRSNLAQVNGSVGIQSETGKGTTFRLSMPLTLAIINAFLVRIGDQTYALPSHDVVENIVISPKDLHKVEEVYFISLRDEVIPLLDVSALFCGKACAVSERQPIVIIGSRHRKVGLIVEDFIEHREIMIKPFNAALEMIDYISGVTILGNGQICLIVDTSLLVNQSK
jgi:two-component system chemotaxis sensor kinase CheA